jgi:hypothetical protein
MQTHVPCTEMYKFYSRVANDRRGSMSEAESDEENEEGDYTVYECPGLAPVSTKSDTF